MGVRRQIYRISSVDSPSHFYEFVSFGSGLLGSDFK